MGKFLEYYIIKKSKMFDPAYYLQTYPDIRKADIDPLKHYCKYGWREGRNPSSEFDTKYYLATYSDVAKAEMNPLFHYVRYGKREGRKINSSGVIKKEYSNLEKLLFLINDAKDKPFLVSKLIYELRHNGIKRTIAKTKFFLRKNLNTFEISADKQENDFASNSMNVVPYYIDAIRGAKIADKKIEETIAIHIYVTNISRLKNLLSRFIAFPRSDLYLSVENCLDINEVQTKTESLYANGRIIVKSVSTKMGAMEAMIKEHSKDLLAYTYIGQFHTDFDESMDLILDTSGIQSGEIFSLLEKGVGVVFAENMDDTIKDPSGWYGNFNYAKSLSEEIGIDIEKFSQIEYPENGMFWAKSTNLKELFALSVSENEFNFPKAKLEQLLRQFVTVCAASHKDQIYRIYRGDTLKDYRYYEEQEDFSTSIVHDDVKVLSYYLGQFHPIPENDEWHGKGFTEWTNVKRAYPLFQGHYQQHIPHEDLGYYLLDDPDVLRNQAQMMKKAGVYGQIFYHYWFSGKLILEKPAQMLLKHKDIDMPFCFCWANENWTKRWDGNEAEILLGQIYSEEDARAFIKYLIPFFQDSRYIRVDNRPVLYVYRPSSMPDAEAYIKIWKEECAKVSISAPYVVAVLTRGATNPHEHAMDAGVERILHDWTAGGVPEIKNRLNPYHEITGSVLSYEDVATFYEKQDEKKDFIYYRSISPRWDNTARYLEGLYALHESSPGRFQKWFENIIQYTKKNLPENQRFIIVNAWNEWAEGAHLEPDSYHGYSYLNSIGRALSDTPYTKELPIKIEIPKDAKILITMTEDFIATLDDDRMLKEQFLFCLQNSSLFSVSSSIISDNDLLVDVVKSMHKAEETEKYDFKIEFRSTVLFDTKTLEKLLQWSVAFEYSKIIPNTYDPHSLYDVTENFSVDAKFLYDAPMIVSSAKSGKNVRLCTVAKPFLAPLNEKCQEDCPEVTTIIRFHKSGDFSELKSALFSLAAMKNVMVKPLIAAQDLDESLMQKLQETVNEVPFKQGIKAQIRPFMSREGKGDLRTQMLNESLKSVKTKYVAFLDYDDILFPDAYDYLISRMRESGKAVSFGRVYESDYDSQHGLLLNRKKKYEYGYTYEEFLGHNHAPLHSFMLDTTKFDFTNILYYEDQRYMEDYLLTLQLFTKENADWEALQENVYIGDYIHCVNRGHTLAFADDFERKKLLDDPEYQKDDQRISQMRKKVMGH